MTRLIEIDLGTKLIIPDQLSNANVDLMPKDKVRRSASQIAENFHIYNHTGFMKVENLIGDIEFYCRAFNIRLVILDHIHAALNSGSDGNDYKIIDFFIAELKRISLQHNTCVIAISHMSRDKSDSADNKPSLNKIRGSHGIAQNSDLVIGMSRPRDTTQAVFETLKPHRLFGIYKTFILNYNIDTMKYSATPLFNTEILEQNESEKEIQQPVNQTVQEPLRVQHSQGKPEDESLIRAIESELSEDLYPRFSTRDNDGQTHVHRGEGISDIDRQNEDETGKEIESKYGHKISTNEPSSEDNLSVEEIINLL